VEGLILEHQDIAATAKGSGQLIAAVAALRELRACIETLGKLSGELSSANINFFAMEINENRIQDFLEAAALRGPLVKQFVRDQVFKRFGAAAPNIQISFVAPPKRNPDSTRVLEALPAPPAPGEATLTNRLSTLGTNFPLPPLH
jgi:hypothetical protein